MPRFPTPQPYQARRAPLSSRRQQAGLTFAGLLVYAVLVAAGVFFVMKVVPSFTEYQSIKVTLREIVKSNPATVDDVRRSFERQRIADPTIQSVTGNDLSVTKEGGRLVIGVKYEKELRMVGPVSLLIRYEASSN
jgi:hypothetical protein